MEESFRFGAGRYLQDMQLLERCGEEILRFGTRAFVITGEKSWAAVSNRLVPSLTQSNIAWNIHIFNEYPNSAATEAYQVEAAQFQADVIIGIGGGRVMDQTKALATTCSLPMIMIPTSAATCAAFSPLSMMYDGGKASGVLHLKQEVNEVIVDEQVMAEQPPRLLAAGILDAMAKYIEIPNGKPEITLNEPVETYSAYQLAKVTYNLLETYGLQAYQDVNNHILTKAVHTVVFCNIALTGIVSALMRGHNQTALAHKLYEALRSYFYEDTSNYLHGEMVGTGLIMQLNYNHDTEELPQLTHYMQEMHMPMTLEQLGLTCTSDNITLLADQLKASRFVPDTKEGYTELDSALKTIW